MEPLLFALFAGVLTALLVYSIVGWLNPRADPPEPLWTPPHQPNGSIAEQMRLQGGDLWGRRRDTDVTR